MLRSFEKKGMPKKMSRNKRKISVKIVTEKVNYWFCGWYNYGDDKGLGEKTTLISCYF